MDSDYSNFNLLLNPKQTTLKLSLQTMVENFKTSTLRIKNIVLGLVQSKAFVITTYATVLDFLISFK